MKLDQWLIENEYTVAEAATVLNVNRATLYRIMQGCHSPSLELLQKIHLFTGGEVSVLDFDVKPRK